MDQITRKSLKDIYSDDADTRHKAFQHIIRVTKEPVAWSYEIWDDLLQQLRYKNNHQRTIAVQVLLSLAESDYQKRMLNDIVKLLEVARDENLITASPSLQPLWKIAVVNKELQDVVIKRLSERFENCHTEKTGTAIRYDIMEVFRKIYNEVNDEAVKEKALELVATEDDPNYRRKYAGVWQDIAHINAN